MTEDQKIDRTRKGSKLVWISESVLCAWGRGERRAGKWIGGVWKWRQLHLWAPWHTAAWKESPPPKDGRMWDSCFWRGKAVNERVWEKAEDLPAGTFRKEGSSENRRGGRKQYGVKNMGEDRWPERRTLCVVANDDTAVRLAGTKWSQGSEQNSDVKFRFSHSGLASWRLVEPPIGSNQAVTANLGLEWGFAMAVIRFETEEFTK